MEPTSIPVIKELKDRLASICLLFLGQHLWSLHVACPNSKPYACICRCCSKARKNYQFATGHWPSDQQEKIAMENWVNGSEEIIK